MITPMNKQFLGIDTSNYTTSLALCSNGKILTHVRRFLPVSEKSKGLRQSDALFFHNKALPEIANELFSQNLYDKSLLAGVAVSSRPRDIEGSYMPCFLSGMAFASAVSEALKIPQFQFSHQAGHIAAALYSSDKEDEIGNEFISFHVSGGTTEIIYNRIPPQGMQGTKGIECHLLGGTTDLNAGQAIDRTGVLLGYSFPCGKKLDEIAQKAPPSEIKRKPPVKGLSCSLSGLENLCAQMLANGRKNEEIARFLFDYIGKTIYILSENVRAIYPKLPILYAGGVMANSIIREILKTLPKTFFASVELSSDNACGIALLCEKRYLSGC